MILMMVLFCGVGLVAIDRWLKYLALGGVSREFGTAQFVLFKNDALVFSWPAPNLVAVVLMLIAIVVVMYVTWRKWQQHVILGYLGGLLMLLGAFSNLYDRLAYGYVVDWAYVGPWWPVFNVADLMVAAGLVLILWRRKGTAR